MAVAVSVSDRLHVAGDAFRIFVLVKVFVKLASSPVQLIRAIFVLFMDP